MDDKKKNELLTEAANSFLRQHPELRSRSNDAIFNIITNEKKVYGVVGVEFGMQWMLEQVQLGKVKINEKPK